MMENRYLDKHLRQAQEIAQLGSWQLEIDSENLLWSEECYNIFGLPRSEEMTLEKFFECVHPDDREFVRAEWEGALQGDPYDIEHRIVADDTTKWVREKAEVEFDASGEPELAVGVVQDITDRKHRQRAIEQERRRYIALFENLPNPVIYAEVREEGPIIEDVNSTYEGTFGVESAQESGDTLYDHLGLGDESVEHDAVIEAIETEGRTRLEVERETTEGTRTFRLDISLANIDADTQLVYGVYTDITSQNEYKAQLEAAKRRYRTLIEAAPDPIFVADAATGKITEANSAASEFRDQPREEIVGLHQSELHPTDNAEAYQQLFDEHVESEGARRELRNGSQIYAVTGDGEQIPVEINAKTVTLPEGEAIFGVFRDITAEKERETRLRMFRKAVEAAGYSMYFTDRDGTITYVNPAFEETTGYSAAEAIGRNPRILKSGEHTHEFYTELWETILRGETWHAEMVNNSKGGDRYVVNQTISPVFDDEGRITSFVAVNSDISELKRREAKLEAERDRAEALRQRLSVVNRIIRHDIRSAVNIIRGHAELARGSTDTRPRSLETIEDQAARLHEIAENARLIDEQLADTEYQRIETDIIPLIQEQVGTLKAEYPDVSVTKELPETSKVHTDGRIGTAIAHILENAVQHNDSDFPKVRIEVWEQPRDQSVILSIADNGPGIPDEEVEPLGQDIEESLSHSSGLGLWITKWIVDNSGGEIRFEENQPRGTEVVIRLPRPDREE